MTSSYTIKIGEIRVGKLTVQILKLTAENRYTGPVVSFSGLPAGMGDEFSKSKTCCAIPDLDHAYLHDFTHWLGRKGLKGEITWL